ncbi:glycine zipper 2TM domain-containing protein [Ruegeria pomeroyi]|nr:glycine zipper 2TM domain-containing protein [Ruegeria pomeroyi]MCE8534642.1 glycine zipper 2TM domain-containing protein [Ruegeria pomeroyi]
MKKTIVVGVLGGAIATILVSCGPAPTARQQAQRQHEIACMSGTIGGALIGGVIGNQFGRGSGRRIMTAGGAVAGGVAGSRYAC